MTLGDFFAQPKLKKTTVEGYEAFKNLGSQLKPYLSKSAKVDFFSCSLASYESKERSTNEGIPHALKGFAESSGAVVRAFTIDINTYSYFWPCSNQSTDCPFHFSYSLSGRGNGSLMEFSPDPNVQDKVILDGLNDERTLKKLPASY